MIAIYQNLKNHEVKNKKKKTILFPYKCSLNIVYNNNYWNVELNLN